MLTWIFAVLIGISLGLLGGGGSILTVPVFVYAAHFDPKTAIAMSYPVVGITALAGAVSHWRGGTVMPRVAVAFGACAMIGAVAGSRLATLLTGTQQLVILASAIVAAAVSMLRPAPVAAHPESNPGWREVLRVPLLAVGVGVGILTGVVGIGGGFLILPALVLLARVPTRSAVGTSLAVIFMNSAVAFAAHLATATIPVGFVAAFTAVAIVGVVAGARIARIVPPASLRRTFAIFLLVIGTLILYQNRRVVWPQASAPSGRSGT